MQWIVKIVAKIVLARLPLPVSFWRAIKLFRHGAMDNPAYALKIFKLHYARWTRPHAEGWTCLELGPGDSLLTALIAKAHGAGRVYLVDAGNFASTEISAFLDVAQKLKAEGLPVPDLAGCHNIEQILQKCGATYLTNGLADLRQIPSGSVDFAFSNAVLEHVRANEFEATMVELARIAHPQSQQSHIVDLRDHLHNSLNNLRFSASVWEGNLFSRSGFYTNRLRRCQIVQMMEKAGFEVEAIGQTTWPQLPLGKEQMHPDFRSFSESELMISTFDVVLTPQMP